LPVSDSGERNDNRQMNQFSRRDQSHGSVSGQYERTRRFQHDSQTAVKTRCSSSQSRRHASSKFQTNTSSACRRLPGEDVDVDGLPTEDSATALNTDPEDLFDFRSTVGISTGPSSPRGSYGSCSSSENHRDISSGSDEDKTYKSSQG